MKCPYRMNEMHTCHDGKTWIYREFADCYGGVCPYFDAYLWVAVERLPMRMGAIQIKR